MCRLPLPSLLLFNLNQSFSCFFFFDCPQGCYSGQSNRREARRFSKVAGAAEGTGAVNPERTKES